MIIIPFLKEKLLQKLLFCYKKKTLSVSKKTFDKLHLFVTLGSNKLPLVHSHKEQGGSYNNVFSSTPSKTH